MSIKVLSFEDASQIANMSGDNQRAIDISSLCDATKLKNDEAIVFYHRNRGVKMFGLVCGFSRQQFVYDKIVTTPHESIARDFNFFAHLYGIEPQVLCNIILENNPW